MINDIENKNSQKVMSDLEYAKNDTEMMRYRVNGLSYKLGLAAMICSLLGAFICLNSYSPRDFQVIMIIILNIIILLGGFLCAEKVKNYNKAGAIGQIVFGAVCIGRIFYVPVILMVQFSKFMEANDWLAYYNGLKREEQRKLKDTLEQMNTLRSESSNYLGQTITSYYNSNRYANAFLPANGYFRGISAMVLFGCAAALFIVAGIIGYQRAKKLRTYLDSINVKN